MQVDSSFRSVVGKALHASHWPTFLRTDSAGVQGVRSSVRLIGAFELFVVLLISVASIVTPLGLYETVTPQSGLKDETFSYAQDNSSMGIGYVGTRRKMLSLTHHSTLPRRNDIGLSRMCSYFRPAACPWSNTTIIETMNSTNYEAEIPDGYDTRIPKNITEIYSAGHSKLAHTVASVFDIQWRTYKKVVKSKTQRNNQPYLVGDYRHLSQMIMNDAWEAIAGLVVNTKTGGIGFRNHTTPPPLPFGSTWSEELLFIEPETECVDMNITLDFNIPLSNDVMTDVENLTVVDHGGFANFNKDIPWCKCISSIICEKSLMASIDDQNKTWAEANLRDRAYLGAWFNNVYSMFYLNVTNPKNKDHPTRFAYLNSTVGAKFPIDGVDDLGSFKIRYDQLMLKGGYGEFLNIPDLFFNGSISNGSLYKNPFKISSENFTDIGKA